MRYYLVQGSAWLQSNPTGTYLTRRVDRVVVAADADRALAAAETEEAGDEATLLAWDWHRVVLAPPDRLNVYLGQPSLFQEENADG